MDLIVPEVESVDTVLVINPDTRVINVGSGLLLGVETDNDAERVKFQCPKIVGDNLDLSQYHIYIHYQNAKGETGKYLCEDVEDAGENITFSWLLSQKVTVFKGATKFLVCAKKTDAETIVWNTTLASGNVLEGLAVDEDIVQQNDDVIEQILLRLERIEDSGGTGDINNAKVTFEEAGERANIESGETISTIFGKIKKWFSDLKAVAFTGSYDDLLNKPDIPTKTSDLTNDSDFLTAVPEEYITDTELEEKGYIIESELPKKLPNPYKLKFTGAVVDEYDGSVEKTINIPEGGSDYTLPQANEELLGGIKAKAKTTETVEVVIDTKTGKLYVPTYPTPSGSSGGLSARYDEVTQNIILEEAGGSSGGENTQNDLNFLTNVTIQEEVNMIEISQSSDGTPFNELSLTEMFVFKGIQVDGVVYTPEGMGGDDGFKLLASVETEEEVARIELSGFEANEIQVFLYLKATGSMVPVFTMNGGWATSDPYINLWNNLATSYFQNFIVYGFAKDKNAYAMQMVSNQGDDKLSLGNKKYEKITSIAVEKLGDANFAAGCIIWVYGR